MVSSGGTAWRFSDAGGNSADSSSAWENDSTFGSATAQDDYKSSIWVDMAKTAIMIKYNGVLLLTTQACHAGKTMQQMFADLEFDSDAQVVSHPTGSLGGNAAHECGVQFSSPQSGEVALLGSSTRDKLFLKWGEREGVQDTNKDRVYLSTAFRSHVHYATGLGAYMSSVNNCGPHHSSGGTCTTVNVGALNDQAISVGPGHVYEIYIK